MGRHALLSPSASERWMNCTPSARLTEHMPDAQSEYTAEGTEAHELCEWTVKSWLNSTPEWDFLQRDESVSFIKPRLSFYSPDMQDAADIWLDTIKERVKAIRPNDWDALTEYDYDLSPWIPEGHGTADFTLLSDGRLEVFDFKYGQGVRVEAEGNTQLMCYALGALNRFGKKWQVKEVSMTIVQPRLSNVERADISAKDLWLWGINTLAPKAREAYDGAGEQRPGKWCKFCKIRQICRALCEEALEAAAAEFSQKKETITDSEVAELLPKLDTIISWARSVKEYALHRAAVDGVQFKGWKLANGRSARTFSDTEEASRRLFEAGKDPYEAPELISVARAEKLFGKKKFDVLFGDLVRKSAGKPVLVPESDKRPEWNPAANDFSE